jgi:two-component system cell cycle response regulator CpdR
VAGSTAPLAPPPSPGRILIVDDDQAICRLARRILEPNRYHVLTSADGTAALEITRRAMLAPGGTISLVLTDIAMPGLDGYALRRQLGLMWPALPVIYMSGTTHGSVRHLPLAPFEHFIAKPFSAFDLLHKLNLVLSLPNRMAEDFQDGLGGGTVFLQPKTVAAATEVARAAVGYLAEEARWALLQDWLEQEPALERKAGRRSLRLEALRGIVAPHVSDQKWDEVVGERRSVPWADELRVANAKRPPCIT